MCAQHICIGVWTFENNVRISLYKVRIFLICLASNKLHCAGRKEIQGSSVCVLVTTLGPYTRLVLKPWENKWYSKISVMRYSWEPCLIRTDELKPPSVKKSILYPVSIPLAYQITTTWIYMDITVTDPINFLVNLFINNRIAKSVVLHLKMFSLGCWQAVVKGWQKAIVLESRGDTDFLLWTLDPWLL